MVFVGPKYTEAGTVAYKGLFEETVTVRPTPAAGPDRVTLPSIDVPPLTLGEFTLIALSA